ncbi:hypothetical protein BKA93DRAFT_830564 [Sparassis latifolia]
MSRIHDQPCEILEAIAGHVDNADDLLAFALSSKIIASVVSPRHTQLRHIRCNVETICLWKALSRDLSLARNVRILEIGDRHPFRLPQFIFVDHTDCRRNHEVTQREAELQLILAMKNLSNLIFFKWRGPTNILIAEKMPDGEDVWTSLTHCRNLRELDVREDFMESLPYPVWGGAMFKLSNLTSFKYWTSVESIVPDLYGLDTETLGIMLREHCPKLQRLHLGFSFKGEHIVPNVEQSIMSGRWPDLRSLHLRWAACSPSAAVSFLVAHPQILVLSVDCFVGSTETAVGLPLDCPPGLLPSLKTLECATSQAADILSLSSPPRPLEHLSLTDLPFSPRQDDFFAILSTLTSIQILQFWNTITLKAISRLAEAAPWLPRLRIPNGSWLLGSCRDPEAKKSLQKLFEPFYRLEAIECDIPELNLLDAVRGP